MIEKLNNNIQNFVRQLNGQSQDSRKTQSTEEADASLEVNYKSLMEKASKSTDNDAEIVAKAKKMMQAGELDNPEKIREAAENIARLSI